MTSPLDGVGRPDTDGFNVGPGTYKAIFSEVKPFVGRNQDKLNLVINYKIAPGQKEAGKVKDEHFALKNPSKDNLSWLKERLMATFLLTEEQISEGLAGTTPGTSGFVKALVNLLQPKVGAAVVITIRTNAQSYNNVVGGERGARPWTPEDGEAPQAEAASEAHAGAQGDPWANASTASDGSSMDDLLSGLDDSPDVDDDLSKL